MFAVFFFALRAVPEPRPLVLTLPRMQGDVETMAAGTLPGIGTLLPAPTPVVDDDDDDDDARWPATAGVLADDDDT